MSFSSSSSRVFIRTILSTAHRIIHIILCIRMCENKVTTLGLINFSKANDVKYHRIRFHTGGKPYFLQLFPINVIQLDHLIITMATHVIPPRMALTKNYLFYLPLTTILLRHSTKVKRWKAVPRRWSWSLQTPKKTKTWRRCTISSSRCGRVHKQRFRHPPPLFWAVARRWLYQA